MLCWLILAFLVGAYWGWLLTAACAEQHAEQLMRGAEDCQAHYVAERSRLFVALAKAETERDEAQRQRDIKTMQLDVTEQQRDEAQSLIERMTQRPRGKNGQFLTQHDVSALDVSALIV